MDVRNITAAVPRSRNEEGDVMANGIQIVGGERSGEYIKWFGNRVRIQGVEHQLHAVLFTDGSKRQYYVKDGMVLSSKLRDGTVERIVVVA